MHVLRSFGRGVLVRYLFLSRCPANISQEMSCRLDHDVKGTNDKSTVDHVHEDGTGGALL